MVAGVKTQHKAKGYDRYQNTTVSGNQTKIADIHQSNLIADIHEIFQITSNS